MGLSNIFSIDQNYPTSNALLVPGPNQSSYTVYIFNYSDWVVGKNSPIYSIAQSAVNSDGTWVGVLDSISQVYYPITLSESASDGSNAGPYTVVAISLSSTILLALQVIAPAPVPPSLIAGTGITITGAWPDQTVSATGGSVDPEEIAKLVEFFK